MKGKVESVEKQSFVDQNGNSYYNVTIDGKKGSYACKTGKEPYFVVGQEQEYEEEVKPDKNGTPRTKFKKPYNPNGFGGARKPIMVKQSEAIRMCKSNAVHAVSVVNAAYNEERLVGADLAAIVAFTTAGITEDFEKFGAIDQDLTSRLAAINNASLQAAYRSYGSAVDLVKMAEGIYKYVTK